MSASTILLLLAFAVTTIRADDTPLSLSKGFSASDMNWVDNQGAFLHSANRTFQLMFQNMDSGIYYLSVVHSASAFAVWTANRNKPIGNSDFLKFEDDGNLVLYATGRPIWSSGTNQTDAQTLLLLDTGNLVIIDSSNRTVWESFDEPTDTLLLNQKLKVGMKLVSSSSDRILSPGPYSLSIQGSTLELIAAFGQPATYWKMSTDSRTVSSALGIVYAAYAIMEPGKLALYDNTSSLLSSIIVSPNAIWLSLRADGSLSSYIVQGSVKVTDFEAPQSKCLLPSPCGPYGICSDGGQCSCPASFSAVNSLDFSKGCRVPILNGCTSGSSFRDLTNVDYFVTKYMNSVKAGSVTECKKLCSTNCSCVGGVFVGNSSSCYLTERFGSFESSFNSSISTFLKLPAPSPNHKRFIYIIISCTLVFILSSIGVFIFWYWWRQRGGAAERDEEDGFLDSIPGLPRRFSYKELQVATQKFSKKLGGGGFGSVYEGTLPDKSKIAVKQLEGIGQGKKEFRAEVATIGSIHHVHLVRLIGFCAEGTHRLLVYEFMARGSLDKSLFVDHKSSPCNAPPDTVLDWKKRFNIALGTVRGLAYLHEDCRERIIHCDIKPENILLDEDYSAKVSDFGLAKLVNRNQNEVFTTLRGTRGYLAPEWLLNYAISEKSDVYSFGMVLLEIVTGRKNFDPNETSEKWYIPAYAFKQAEIGGLLDLVDPRLNDEVDETQALIAIKVALWCIQEDVPLRPPTGKVVQMLEGNVPVPDPPLSSLFGMKLHARMVDAVGEKDRFSSPSDFNSQDLLSASRLSGPR